MGIVRGGAAALVLSVLLGGTTTLAQQFKCPHEYGFYPHEKSCDKYYKCENNVAELKTCGNGLGFEASDPKFLSENCDYLHNVDCGDRVELEPPISSPNCPRLYGIFADEEKCDTFWSCWNGEANRYTCAPGLAYDAEARVCMWADQVEGCNVRQTGDGSFQCPDTKLNPPAAGTFSRHAHPDDCRKYYVCLDGNPREYGCPIGTVFKIGSDSGSGQCEDPEGVEGCENYYGDELKGIKKSQLLLNDYNYDKGTTTQRSVNRKKTTPVVAHHQQQQTQPQQQPQQQQEHRQHQDVRRPNKLRPTTATRATTTTTTTPTTTTTTTRKPDVKEDEYYYYDENYDQQQDKKQ
jgi:hypothetical protein